MTFLEKPITNLDNLTVEFFYNEKLDLIIEPYNYMQPGGSIFNRSNLFISIHYSHQKSFRSFSLRSYYPLILFIFLSLIVRILFKILPILILILYFLSLFYPHYL